MLLKRLLIVIKFRSVQSISYKILPHQYWSYLVWSICGDSWILMKYYPSYLFTPDVYPRVLEYCFIIFDGIDVNVTLMKLNISHLPCSFCQNLTQTFSVSMSDRDQAAQFYLWIKYFSFNVETWAVAGVFLNEGNRVKWNVPKRQFT